MNLLFLIQENFVETSLIREIFSSKGLVRFLMDLSQSKKDFFDRGVRDFRGINEMPLC